jgi:toxin ParE1/3/4
VAHFTRTRRAEEDLIEIWTFIAQDDVTAADQLLDRIDAVVRGWPTIPLWGQLGRTLRPG